MQPYLSLLGYCAIVAVCLAILWKCVFAPYKRYREEQLLKFTELNQHEFEADLSPEELELINES